jgi:hypothetical protein
VQLVNARFGPPLIDSPIGELAMLRCTDILLAEQTSLRVAAVNGDRLTSPGYCRRLPIFIHDECFFIDYYGLALGSYDMVLGVQWLESLSPIPWDFSQRTLAFVCDGHHVVWHTLDTTAPLLP